MVHYKINDHYYTVEQFNYKRMKVGLKFYSSDDYFIKEYDFAKLPQYKAAFPRKIINFYKHYYKSGGYSAPELIEYEVTKSTAKLVYKKINSQDLEAFFVNNDVTDTQGRQILKLILDAILPFEVNGIPHGDVELHNMILKDNKVYMIDFDHFGGKKEDLAHFIGSVIYNAKNAHISKKVISQKALKLPTDINEYHNCCTDIAQAIINKQVASVQNIIDLMAVIEGNDAEQN